MAVFHGISRCASSAVAGDTRQTGDANPVAKIDVEVVGADGQTKGSRRMIVRPPEADDLRHITPRQEAAIELLLTGSTDTSAAAALNLHRTTIARWRGVHPAFQAELARRREELYGAAAERLRALVPKAITVLESALDGKDALATAHELLRMTGLHRLAPPERGPHDVEAILSKLVRTRMDDIEDELEHYGDEAPIQRLPPNRERDMADGFAALADVRESICDELSDWVDPVQPTVPRVPLAGGTDNTSAMQILNASATCGVTSIN